MKALKAKELIGQGAPWLVLNIAWLWLHETGHYGMAYLLNLKPYAVVWGTQVPSHRVTQG
jgi:hypothetical protein